MAGISRRNVVRGFTAIGASIAVPRSSLNWLTRRATAFGTVISISAASASPLRVDAAIATSFNCIREIERVMSLFEPGSAISRLNRIGHLAAPDALLLRALDISNVVWKLNRGAFDPTVQRLWEIWSASRNRPSLAEVGAARALVGFGHVGFDRHNITLARPGMALTLNGIAQGLAADLVASEMMAHGIEQAFFDTGEIGSTAIDAVQQRMISIRDPHDSRNVIGFLEIGRAFVATSGDYATAFTPDFSNHHIFDPSTGRSPTELASATVVARSGAMADALATACLVFGRNRALAVIEEVPGAGAVLIGKNRDFAISNMLRRRFKLA